MSGNVTVSRSGSTATWSGSCRGPGDGHLARAVGGDADLDHRVSPLSIGTARERGGRCTSGSSTRSIPSS